MEPTEEQLTALGNYRDIIIQHAPEVAEAIGVSPERLKGWTEGNGEPTSEQADKILAFLREQNKAGIAGSEWMSSRFRMDVPVRAPSITPAQTRATGAEVPRDR
jgi:hypothetical protein